MSAVAPLTTEAATELLERYSVLSGKAGAVAGRRDLLLDRANVATDKLIAPIAAEMEVIKAQLEPWWKTEGVKLLTGKRKSIELGGCMVGTKQGRASLQLRSGDFDKEAEKLRKLAWAEPFVRVTVAIDKTATRNGLAGPLGAKLKARGFFEKPGADEFFVDRVAQAGTIGPKG
jgi:hypothetical protein